MKVHIVQPFYYTDYSKSDECFEHEMNLFKKCTPEYDIIVFPEASDVPCFASSDEEFRQSVKKYNSKLLNEAHKTAIRCNAVVFINAYDCDFDRFRNTTFTFDRNGNVVGKYYKQHLTPGETKRLDNGYSFEPSEPYTIDIDGIRYGFLTCYDFYFYEMADALARKNIDIIIGCSHQRSDSYKAIEMMCKFFAYNTNAYVLRSSVSMGKDSVVGGASMIVAPDTDVIASLHSEQSEITADIDPHKKLYKPAGFGNPSAAHYEYTEKGRRPWKYRPAGSFIAPDDSIMPYPRVCAHRGFNTIAPENSLPAFGAAIALGAQEIEFDLWYTKDNEIVSIHDSRLDRVSDGTGFVYEHTYEELLKFDFGIKFGDKFSGLRILRFEDILKKFACQVIMNVHVKCIDESQPYDDERLDKIISLIKKYDCEKYVYIMSANDSLQRRMKEKAPEIHRCCGAGRNAWEIVDRAIALGCEKVQLFKPHFDRSMVEKAHANGILCNVFYADTPEEARKYLDMGIDTILTNDYNLISQAVFGTQNCVKN